jgi:hypothetical protein
MEAVALQTCTCDDAHPATFDAIYETIDVFLKLMPAGR